MSTKLERKAKAPGENPVHIDQCRYDNYTTSHLLFIKPTKQKRATLSRPGVRDIQHQNIRRPDLRQFIHNSRNLLLLHHRANSHPAIFFERGDGGRALAGRDAGCRREFAARNIVLAEDVFLSGYI